ncbi:hypothetical protein E4H12_00770 [Candidatus Thorarchaeota archaeon]|nr:MAG: hypothetical protein E4H12_00770 [Candidatus Thorarchaeota archaeon]
MPKVQETTSITVDDVVFAVDKMSDNVKQMVVFMDEWRQTDTDLVVEMTMVKAALRDIQNNIYVAINKEKTDAMEKAKAMVAASAEEQVAPAAADDMPGEDLKEVKTDKKKKNGSK